MSVDVKNFFKFNKSKWWLFSVAIFLLIFIGAFLIYRQAAASQKFISGIKVGYLDLGGLTKPEALTKLKEIESNIQSKGFKFTANERQAVINPAFVSANDPDLAKSILLFDWESTLKNAYSVGRSDSWWQNLSDRLNTLISGRSVPIDYYLNTEDLEVALKNNFSELEKPPVNTKLKIENDAVEVADEVAGYVFDYQSAISRLKENIASLDFSEIKLELSFQDPEIKKSQTGSAVNSLENILTVDSLKLTIDPYWWLVGKAQFISWLEFQLVGGEVVVGFNKDSVLEFLKPIAEQINIEANDAKFKIDGDRVVEFQASQDGKKINLDESYDKINQQVIVGDFQDVELPTEVTLAQVSTGDVNDLGIKDLIGRGVSNFAGSPVNRRHNIAVGAAKLNGVLIEPDKEFSVWEILGDINAESGYKPELVIKGDRTIPEYGGGLCQIGTTVFRVALRSGLPITQRREHSYRVVYYEPAGMDATIYNPSPDVKFINDTGYHILFTTKIVGDELIFEFYGTKDGRKVAIEPDPPSIYNITSPGAPRYIETEDLAPGEKRKVESPHRGADTYFKYTVSYPNGEVKQQDFYSHYIAWPEVWLIGKTPTTTNEIVEPSN